MARKLDAKHANLVILEIVLELARAAGVTQLGKRLGLDLADTLTRDAELATDLLERTGMTVDQPEACLLYTSPDTSAAPCQLGSPVNASIASFESYNFALWTVTDAIPSKSKPAL